MTKKLMVKDQRMVTFAPIHRSLDKVASEVRQSDSSTQTPKVGESIIKAQTIIGTTEKIDPSANGQL